MTPQTAESLVLELHGMLLRLVSRRSGHHFQGLSQAARHLRKSGLLDNKTVQKFIRIDNAFNIVRHITSVSVDSYVSSVSRLLDAQEISHQAAKTDSGVGVYKKERIEMDLQSDGTSFHDFTGHANLQADCANEYLGCDVYPAVVSR